MSVGAGREVLAGRRPVLESLRAGNGTERILIARGLAPSSVVAEIRRRARERSVPVKDVPRSAVDELAAGVNHQGVVALTTAFRYASLHDVLASADAAVLYLDGVMDPHNVGSLLRSAGGAGFAGVVLRSRHAAGVTGAARRVSAGAAETVPVVRTGNLGAALDEGKRAGLWIVGLDQDARESLWTSPLVEPPVGLVLGAEDRGLSPAVRKHCDLFVKIPLGGALSSLNVAGAGAVAMFEVARRRFEGEGARGVGEGPGSNLERTLE